MRLWLLLVLLAVASSARAQDARSYVAWSADPVVVGADGNAVVRLTGTVAPGWKMYALTSPSPAPALRVSVDTAAGRMVGPPRHIDAPVAAFDSLLGVPVEQLTGRARLEMPVQINTPPGGGSELPVSLRFAICDASICLAPRTVVIPVALRRMETATQAPESVPALKDAKPPAAAPLTPGSSADTQTVGVDTMLEVLKRAMPDPEVASVEAPAAPRDGRPWTWPAALVALVVVVGAGLWAVQRRRADLSRRPGRQ